MSHANSEISAAVQLLRLEADKFTIDYGRFSGGGSRTAQPIDPSALEATSQSLLSAGLCVARYSADLNLGEEAAVILRLSRELARGDLVTTWNTVKNHADAFDSALCRVEAELLKSPTRRTVEVTKEAEGVAIDRAIANGAKNSWATYEEIDTARKLAERGLELLTRVSDHADSIAPLLNRLVVTGANVERVQAWLQQVIPGIERVAVRSADIRLTEEQESFWQCIRTIERCWTGARPRPFANYDAADYRYATAHAAVTQWASAFQHWVTRYDESFEKVGYESAEMIAQAVCQFQLRPGESQNLALQVVEEWRAAHDFLDQQPASPATPELRKPPATPLNVWATRLVVSGPTIVTLDGTPHSVSADSAALFAAMIQAYPVPVAARDYNSKPDRMKATWPQALQAIIASDNKGYRLVNPVEYPDAKRLGSPA